jgi:hypothetical protein
MCVVIADSTLLPVGSTSLTKKQMVTLGNQGPGVGKSGMVAPSCVGGGEVNGGGDKRAAKE